MWMPSALDATKTRYIALFDAIGIASRAYHEAERIGLVQARVGSGTFVFQHSQDGSALQTPSSIDGFIDLCANFALPPHPLVIQQVLKDILDRLPQLDLLGYQLAQGVPHQLLWAQTWFRYFLA